METLNKAQRQAVETIEGPVLVVAGPGTGKTQLLSARVAYILEHTDTDASNILLLTFTDNAARNMRERLQSIIGEAANRIAIHTFHSFGSDLIQRSPEFFLDDPVLQPIEQLATYELLFKIFEKLPHRNPLQVRFGDDFYHLSPTQEAISWLKAAGLEPEYLRRLVKDNQAFITFAEPLLKLVFADRAGSKYLPQYQQLLTKLQDFSSNNPKNSLAQQFCESLATAINEIDPAKAHAKSMTAWRKNWLNQTHLKEWVPKDRRYNQLLAALAEVYQAYQSELLHRGWYNFDDMILRTVRALTNNEELRLTLQEQYQYIMVDEYQDTSGGQNKLLDLLADNPVNEGRPNLLVVGDDDQAIYRFQGAQSSIMVDFTQRWRDVSQIVLTENYRSGPELLELAQGVITQGQDRLENVLPHLTKQLTSGLNPPPKTTITQMSAVTELDQAAGVADHISKLIKAGRKPSEIAVLAPKHRYLETLVPYLLDREVPVAYERREDVLEQPRIIEIIELARLVQACADGQWTHAAAILPEVLSGNYWQIPALELWNLSRQAYTTKKSWLDLLPEQTNKHLQNFAKALPVLAKHARVEGLEVVIDTLIGNRAIILGKKTEWLLPYKTFYFSAKRLQQTPTAYLDLLSQLTTLREHLREYRPGTLLKLQDLLDFVQLYQFSPLHLNNNSPHASAAEAVNLMTPYTAKGLEWSTVFIICAQDDVWGPKTRGNSRGLSLTSNLKWIKPASDADDDRLRLFYVALTRARRELYITSYEHSMTGKVSPSVSWLVAADLKKSQQITAKNTKDLLHTQEIQWQLSKPERQSLLTNLQPMLSTYQLSATHLSSFLDVTKGGPKHFFMNHLLHVPEAPSASSAFGSAIHDSLHYLHNELTASRGATLPSLKKTQDIFLKDMEVAALPAEELKRLKARGMETLQDFYNERAKQLQPTDKSEYNFKHEGVTLGNIRLTGKLDVLRQSAPQELTIIDYKTGKPWVNWKPREPFRQVRAHLYQQQLSFYQLLVKGSTSFGKQSVTNSCIEFVEADEDGKFWQLDYLANAEQLERLQLLISKVWQHIMELNFPDTRDYPLTLRGIQQFEQDLLDGKI